MASLTHKNVLQELTKIQIRIDEAEYHLQLAQHAIRNQFNPEAQTKLVDAVMALRQAAKDAHAIWNILHGEPDGNTNAGV